MKVAQVNSPLASTHGQPAEETSNRADAFARVLQTAVFGRGSEAVAKSTERAMAAAAPRTETRPVERRERAEPATTRPNTTPAPRKDTVRETNARDAAAAQKSNESKAPAKTEAKPTKDIAEKPVAEPTEKAPEDTGAAAPQQDAAAQPVVEQTVEQTAEQADAQDAAGETAEETLLEDAGKLVVADAPDAALILALLQTQVAPVDAAAAVTTVAPVAAPAADAAAVTTVPVVPSTLSPEEAAAAALAAAEAQAKTAAPVQTAAADAEPIDAKAAAPVVAQPALPAGAADPQIKTATDTSAAALLSQQQTVSAEDFAALQQALTAQNQGQVQVQEQAGKPVVTAEAKQKAEPKADKIMTIDVQTVTATPKTLVDQAVLFAMQDDDQAAADMAQLQQQTQAALQQQSQPTASDLKFNAALLQAAADDIALQAGSTASSSGTNSQQTAAIGATTATQATQATHQAATQTAARHLNAYVPVGEQVGVQIKKGVAEGLDKISIKLDPGNLGKVEIKLEIGHDGRLQAVIAADKPETLHLLQQDVKNLEQSLRDAGLKTDQQSLNFTLRDQSQANEGRDGNGAGNGRYQNRGGDEYAETGTTTDPAQLAAANAQRAAAARGGLDIRI